MRMLAKLVALLMLTLLGCAKSDLIGQPGAIESRASSPALEMIQRAGDRGDSALIVVMRPERWEQERVGAGPWLKLAGLTDAQVSGVLAAPNPWAAFFQLSQAMSAEHTWPQSSAGWDWSRPVVLFLGEAQTLELGTLLSPFGRIQDLEFPGIRHRVLIPALDAKQLQGTLIAALKALGFQSLGETDAGLPGQMVFTMPRDGYLALAVEPDLIRIEMVSGRLCGKNSQAQCLTPWLQSIQQAPAHLSLPDTPALRFVATNRDLVSFYARPWILRSLGFQHGYSQITQALIGVDPSQRAMLQAQGLAELLMGYLWMTPEGAEFDDLALGLSLFGGMQLTLVASLTELGDRVYQAGLVQAQASWMPGDAPALAKLWVPFSYPAALSKAKSLVLNRLREDTRGPEKAGPAQLAEMARECGMYCFWHIASRNPVGTLKTLLDLMPAEVAQRVPYNMSLMLSEARRSPFMLKGSAAFDVVSSFDSAPLSQAMKYIEMLDPEHPSPISFFQETKADRKSVLIGVAQDPRATLKPAPSKAEPGLLASMEINLAGLIESLGATDPGIAELVRQFPTIKSRAMKSGRALVGQMAAGQPAWLAGVFAQPQNYAGLSWISPGQVDAASPGQRCMQQVVVNIMHMFSALAFVDPAQRSQLTEQGMKELEEPVRCALRDPQTRSSVIALQLAMARLFGGTFNNNILEQVLQTACQNGLADTCAQLQKIQSQPRPNLARVGESCNKLAPQYAAPILVDKTGKVFDPPGRSAAEPVLLAVDQGAPFSTLQKAVLQFCGKASPIGLTAAGIGQQPVELKIYCAASSDNSTDQQGNATILALKLSLEKGSVVVEGPGKNVVVKKPDECKDAEPCPNGIKQLHDKLQEIRDSWGDWPVWWFLDLENDVSWQQAAELLGAVQCDPRQEGLPPAVFLGPPPAALWKSAIFGVGDSTSTTGLSGIGEPGTAIGGMENHGFGSGKGRLGGRSPTKPQGSIQIQAEKAEVRGSLSKEVIRRVVHANNNQVKYCYERRLLRNPKLQGRVDLQFVISAKGEVDQVKVEKETLNDSEAIECLKARVKSWKFPKPKGGGIVIVDYPFIFKSNE